MNDVDAARERNSPSIRQDDIAELKPGETIRAKAPPPPGRSYVVRLQPGQAVTVTVSTLSGPIVVKTYSPSGLHIADFHQQQPELLTSPTVIWADAGGDFRLTLYGPNSECLIVVDPVRAATGDDKKRFLAQSLFVDYWYRQRRAKESLPLMEQRIAIYREINDLGMLGLSSLQLADEFQGSGEFSKAATYYLEALGAFRKLGHVPMESWTLIQGLANNAINQRGEYQEGINYLQEAVSISQAHKYKLGIYEGLFRLGAAYALLGDDQRAKEAYQGSLTVSRSVTGSCRRCVMNQSTVLISLGRISRGVRPVPLIEGRPRGPLEVDANSITAEDARDALQHYQNALEIFRTMKAERDRFGITGEPDALREIGETYLQLGDLPKALENLNQAAELSEKIDPPYFPGRIDILVDLAAVHLKMGEPSNAVGYLEQTIAFGRNLYTESERQVAIYLYRAGETKKALGLFEKALTISRAKEQRSVTAAILYELARIERDADNFGIAKNHIEEAINIAESLRTRLHVQNLRVTYLTTVKKYYDFYIDLLMQAHKSRPDRGHDAQALMVSERARSRSLLDMLSLSGIDLRAGVESSLLTREKQALARLAEKAYQQNILLLGNHKKEDAEKIEREISTLTDEYEKVLAEIRSKSPRYAALTQPSPLAARQIQELLDPGTVLLAYTLGETSSYLWVVTHDSLASFDLPNRSAIEEQTKRTNNLMTERNRVIKGETFKQAASRFSSADAEYLRASAALSEVLLAPAAQLIRNKRLVVVPDGALNYLPFAALSSPKGAESGATDAVPIGVSHEIITLPSASTLARLREEFNGRPTADKLVAIFADPVFSSTDARIRVRGSGRGKTVKLNDQSTVATRDFEQAVADVGLEATPTGGLPRLSFSRREADAIFAASPPNLSLKAVDFKASKQEVLSVNLDQFRIIHFATHGLLNSQHPELSGIVLSLVNNDGSRMDGFLRLQDVYNLKLQAELVVLSACNTALGKEVRGEGMIGLTRGFMYAGAPRVVSSLWKVDDSASKELMSIFYRNMLKDNMRPAAALRAAQTEMMKQRRWRSPYYWAPFVLQGEWK